MRLRGDLLMMFPLLLAALGRRERSLDRGSCFIAGVAFEAHGFDLHFAGAGLGVDAIPVEFSFGFRRGGAKENRN